MTPDELRAALKELGWSAPHLARLLGVGEKTPTNWMLGRANIPKETGWWVLRHLSAHRTAMDVIPPPRAAAGKERGDD